MNVFKLFGEYISATDFEGKDVTLKIERVEHKEIEDEEKKTRAERWILYFEGARKPLLLNRTNATCIAAMFSSESEAWAGHRVTFYTTTIESGKFKGEKAVRVRGSPELPANLTFEMKLPRKKPVTVTLLATGKGAA